LREGGSKLTSIAFLASFLLLSFRLFTIASASSSISTGLSGTSFPVPTTPFNIGLLLFLSIARPARPLSKLALGVKGIWPELCDSPVTLVWPETPEMEEEEDGEASERLR
jgi:hypothetical protein